MSLVFLQIRMARFVLLRHYLPHTDIVAQDYHSLIDRSVLQLLPQRALEEISKAGEAYGLVLAGTSRYRGFHQILIALYSVPVALNFLDGSWCHRQG